MVDKVKFIQSTKEFHLLEGEFDTDTVLTAPVKMKLKSSTGDFQCNDIAEGDDVLEQTNSVFDTGTISGIWARYTQTNISVTAHKNAGKTNRYGYVIHRVPDIPSTLTWGGVVIYPPDADMLVSGKDFRLSFDYRGYSGGHTMNVYQNVSVGWGTLGVNLATPWSYNISPFDTDWEWIHSDYDFSIDDAYLNYVGGHYDWDAGTQYGDGYYGIRHNGNLYRHRSGWTIPTLGVDPETEYQAGGVYDVKWTGGAAPGFFNLYDQIKIGFTYQAQDGRGTHVHVDNIYLTDITNNNRFKYNLATSTWESENLSESEIHILAKGTAYMSIARSDAPTLDVFACEGTRVLEVNGTSIYNTGGRGLRLTVLTEATQAVVSDVTYDVHGTPADITALATALSNITSDQIWVLTSFDAIGSESTHSTTPALRNQLIAMKSQIWDWTYSDQYLWAHSTSDVRNTYAAVGRGQRIIKEDGAGASDSIYKRKGVIDLRI